MSKINKNKKSEHFMAWSFRVNEEERNILRRLKNEYGINLSGITKIFLREKLEELDNLKNKKSQ